MIASIRVMDALKTIGLNLYERKLWVSLLAKGAASAGELSQMSGVPRSRTYDILESLTNKGFVITQVGKPVRFVAMKPDEAMDRVKKKIESDTEEIMKRIDDLKKSPILKELGELFGKGVKTVVPEEMTGTLKGKHHMHRQVSSMIAGANKRIQIVTNPDGLRELHDNHLEHLKKAKSRGVDVKIATVMNEGSKDAARILGGIANVKTFDSDMPVKGNFFIVDGKEIVFALTDPGKVHDTQHVAMWSKSEHAASDMLEPIFKMLWGAAK